MTLFCLKHSKLLLKNLTLFIDIIKGFSIQTVLLMKIFDNFQDYQKTSRIYRKAMLHFLRIVRYLICQERTRIHNWHNRCFKELTWPASNAHVQDVRSLLPVKSYLEYFWVRTSD